MFGLSGGMSAADAARLRRVERKLDLILQHLGLNEPDATGGLSAAVRALADQGPGMKIAAIKQYREETGAGLAEAKQVIEEYQGR